MINFEAHVTVDPSQEQALRDAFPNIKVLSFLNHAPGGLVIPDVMTSGTMSRRSLDEAIEEVEHLGHNLTRRGITVLRSKIEAEPWCGLPGSCHETHLRVMGDAPTKLVGRDLWSRSWKNDTFATVRTHNLTFREHVDQVHVTVSRLLRSWNCQVVGDVEHELVVWDTNPDHDAAWEGR